MKTLATVIETILVKCTQCGGKGIVGSPRVTDGPAMCDKCRGTGQIGLRGYSIQHSERE